MHPAPSIIVFTTSSGLGYGLAAMLGLGLIDPASWPGRAAHVAALVLIAGGLVSSTLHLGNPQRAWRALSQWRSSWLSREGVLAVVTFVPLTIVAYFAVFHGERAPLLSLVGAVLSLATVYCTAMIYASLRAIQAWHNRLTPVCYLLFSASGGALLAMFFTAAGAGRPLLPAVLAILLLPAAWIAKLEWRRKLKHDAPRSTPESATGLGGLGRVRLTEAPHGTENYLTREMGFKVARKHAGKLFRIAFLAAGILPLLLALVVLLTGAGTAGSLVALVAVLSFAFGMLVERWLFFAEAKHAVMNYYTS